MRLKWWAGCLSLSVWFISVSGLLRSSLLTRSRTTSLQAALSLSERVGEAVRLKYSSGGGGDVSRVLKCWSDFTEGKKLHRYVDAPANEVLQTADCFVDGLTRGLEDNYKLIRDELVAYEYKRRAMPVSAEVGLQLAPTGSGQQGDGDWLGPRDTSGTHYGPEWKTLGIQDRSAWDAELTREFPRTIELMNALKVPSCEVFFAKQGPRSGLKPHSDKNNFIMTCHLALDVPEGQCWIQCGVEKHHWLNGKTCIFDTSIIHSTENSSDLTALAMCF
jgi:Aspartyl/Asparaginyl beta-hydroxylase